MRISYSEYLAGQKNVTLSFGAITAEFETISPKNYWHLSIGSGGEYRFIQEVLDYLRPGDVVLDLGGIQGLYPVLFAKTVTEEGAVYVFEPETKGFDAIKKNVALNHLKNVILSDTAVSDTVGRSAFFIRPDKDTHSVFEDTPGPSPLGIQEAVTVDVSTLDELQKRGVIPQPTSSRSTRKAQN